MAGRPAKTDEQKILEGTFRHDRANNNRPQFSIVANATPPVELDARALDEWHFITTELKNIGILQSVDMFAIAAYCIEMSTYWRCQAKLKNGLTYMTPTGQRKPKPEYAMAAQSLNAAMKIAARFGFTPADRQKLTIPKKETKKDPLAELLSGK